MYITYIKRKRSTWCYVDVYARRLPPCAPCADRASFQALAVPRVRGCSPYFRPRDYFRYDLPPSRPVCSWGRLAKVERAKPHRLSELFLSFFLFVCLFSFYECTYLFFFFLYLSFPNIIYQLQVCTGTYRLSFVLLPIYLLSLACFSFELEGKRMIIKSKSTSCLCS